MTVPIAPAGPGGRRRRSPTPGAAAAPSSLRLFDALDRQRHLGDLAADAAVDLRGDVRCALEELLRGLAALAEARLLVGEPRARLRHDVHRHADVEQPAFLRHALAVHDVELSDPERRRDLVLHDLDADAVADRFGARLDRLDAPDVEPDAGVELQRAAARRRLGIAEHHADLLAQ